MSNLFHKKLEKGGKKKQQKNSKEEAKECNA